MNKSSNLNSFCRSVFLIGFAGISATISSVQAADVGMVVLNDPPVQHSAKSTSTILEDSTAPLRGAQGPIRTETFNDAKPMVDTQMVSHDLELQRYPISSEAAIP